MLVFYVFQGHWFIVLYSSVIELLFFLRMKMILSLSTIHYYHQLFFFCTCVSLCKSVCFILPYACVYVPEAIVVGPPLWTLLFASLHWHGLDTGIWTIRPNIIISTCLATKYSDAPMHWVKPPIDPIRRCHCKRLLPFLHWWPLNLLEVCHFYSSYVYLLTELFV